MNSNDWQVDTPDSYSPNKFYTRSTDSKGHREEIRLKLSPDLADALSIIVQSKAIPEYRTVQDIIRDAIVHRLHYLHESGMVKGIDSSLRRHLAIETLLEHEEWAARFDATLKKLVQQVKSLLLERDPEALEHAKQIVRNAYAEASSMTDQPYWRKKYIDYIEHELGPLLKDLNGR